MQVADRIRGAIAVRNREIALEAGIEAALGLLFCALIFGAVFVIALLAFAFFLRGFRDLATTAWIALGATALYALVATLSAWRQVNPLQNVRKLTDFEERMLVLSPMLPFGIGLQPRHTLAGFGMLLIAGPANLFEAWGTWRHRVPGDAQTVDAAAELLHRAENEVVPDNLDEANAALVLRRLGLIKVVGTREKRLGLTQKGEEMLRSGIAPGARR